jgi:hypothetical protein
MGGDGPVDRPVCGKGYTLKRHGAILGREEAASAGTSGVC